MSRTRGVLLLGVLLAPLSWGCADSDAEELASTEEGTVRVGIDAEPSVSISGNGQPPLSSIMAIVEVESGELLVVDRLARAVHVFDGRSGAFVRSFGRGGAGPGEFQYPSGLGVHGDRVWIYDSRLRRLSFFSLGGSLLETFSDQGAVPGEDEALRAVPVAGFDDGSLLGATDPLTLGRFRGRWGTFPVVRMSGDGVVLNRIGDIRVDGVIMTLWPGGVMTQPFQDHDLWAPTRDRDGIVVVKRAFPRERDAEYRVVRLDAGGDTVWERTYPVEARPAGPDRVRDIADSLKRIWSDTRPDRADDAARAIDAQIARPAFLSPVSRMWTGRSGHVWVERDRIGEMAEYDVIGPGGRRLGTVALPRSWIVYAVAGDHVWVAIKDRMDVPSVHRFEISLE